MHDSQCVEAPVQPPEHWIRAWSLKADDWYSRVAILVSGCSLAAPPEFYESAIHALRTDAMEEVVVLVAARVSSAAAAQALRAMPAVRVITYAAGANATLDARAHFTLLAADHVVVEHPSLSWAHAAQRGAARAPYHAVMMIHFELFARLTRSRAIRSFASHRSLITWPAPQVWAWCGSDGACPSNAPVGSGDNKTHVQVEVRRGSSAIHTTRLETTRLEVRSTFTKSSWLPLPATTASASAGADASSLLDEPMLDGKLPAGMWAMRDVCVGFAPAVPVIPSYFNDVSRAGLFADRRAILLQATRTTPLSPQSQSTGSAEPAQLLWPLRWPRHYDDGDAAPYKSSFNSNQEAFFAEIVQAHRAASAKLVKTSRPGTRRRQQEGRQQEGRQQEGRQQGLRSTRWSDYPLTATWFDRAAILLEMTMDNLFHALFHAIPLREDLLALHAPLLRATARLLEEQKAQQQQPQAQQQQPQQQQPQQQQQQRPESEAVERGVHDAGATALALPGFDWLPRYTVIWPASTSVRGWVGWEMVTRALAASLNVARPAHEDTDAMLTPLAMRCYPLVLGGHSPFWPMLRQNAQGTVQAQDARGLQTAQPRLASLRLALWRSIRSQGRPRPPAAAAATLAAAANADVPTLPASTSASASAAAAPILFAVRSSSNVRSITNWPSVYDALEAHPALLGHVRYLALEGLSLRSQLEAVAAARVLVGVHGMGMAWVAMMSTGGGGTDGHHAALEIFPQQMVIQRTHAWMDYRRWAYMNSVEYFLLTQPDTPACRNLDFRRCGNTTVVPAQLAAALARVLEHTMPPGHGQLGQAASMGSRPREAEGLERATREAASPPQTRLAALNWKSKLERQRWQVEGTTASLECLGEKEASSKGGGGLKRAIIGIASAAVGTASGSMVVNAHVAGSAPPPTQHCALRWLAADTAASSTTSSGNLG